MPGRTGALPPGSGRGTLHFERTATPFAATMRPGLDGTMMKSFDLAALLDESIDQWQVEARAEPTGSGAAIRRGARAIHIARPRGEDTMRGRWTLDGDPLASVLDLLREVRLALDPGFVPMRLRVSTPPPVEETDVGRPARQQGTPPVRGRLPVFVLTGFLGSGKTTLLNRLLRAEGLRDTAVVVNELGAIGIDHLLVESADDSVVELAGGCLCCAVRGDLALTLGDLVARREAGACTPFSRILIETSGLADPTPIESLLLADPALAERMELAGVTTCVAATTGGPVLDRYPEAVRQVAAADLLVTTKTDLARVPAALDERLQRLNPGADRLAAEFGRARPVNGAPGTETVADGAPADALPHRRRSGAVRPPVPTEPIRHADGVDTLALVRREPIPGAALTLFLRALVEHAGPRLLRVKGFVEIAEAPGRPVTVNGAGHVFEPVEPRPGGWPDADRRSRLVLIGEGVSAPWCERLLDALVVEVREVAGRLPRP